MCYERGSPPIREAVLRADCGMVRDSPALDKPPRHILVFVNGRPIQVEPYLPEWGLSVYAGVIPANLP